MKSAPSTDTDAGPSGPDHDPYFYVSEDGRTRVALLEEDYRALTKSAPSAACVERTPECEAYRDTLVLIALEKIGGRPVYTAEDCNRWANEVLERFRAPTPKGVDRG